MAAQLNTTSLYAYLQANEGTENIYIDSNGNLTAGTGMLLVYANGKPAQANIDIINSVLNKTQQDNLNQVMKGFTDYIKDNGAAPSIQNGTQFAESTYYQGLAKTADLGLSWTHDQSGYFIAINSVLMPSDQQGGKPVTVDLNAPGNQITSDQSAQASLKYISDSNLIGKINDAFGTSANTLSDTQLNTIIDVLYNKGSNTSLTGLVTAYQNNDLAGINNWFLSKNMPNGRGANDSYRFTLDIPTSPIAATKQSIVISSDGTQTTTTTYNILTGLASSIVKIVYSDSFRLTPLTETDVVYDPLTGTATTTTTNYNPFDDGGMCTFTTVVTPAKVDNASEILVTGTPISSITGSYSNYAVNGTASNVGQLLALNQETITGSNVMSDADGFTINFSKGSSGSVFGSNDIITLPAGIAVSVSGQNDRIVANGNEITLLDGSATTVTGAGNTFVVEKNASVTITSDPNAPNVAAYPAIRVAANDERWQSALLFRSVAGF